MKTIRTIYVIFVIALLLGACQVSSPGATATPTATPIIEPTPTLEPPLWPESCTKSQKLDVLLCPVNIHVLATYHGKTIYDQEEIIDTEVYGKTWYYNFYSIWWGDATYNVEEELQVKVARNAESTLETIGIQGAVFDVNLLSGKLPEEVVRPLEEWEVVFEVELKNTPKMTASESWAVSVQNKNETAYLTAYSLNGEVEIPLRYSEVEELLSGAYKPTEALKNVIFYDPSASAGTDLYEEKVLRYAAQIADEGDLIGRFNWTSINGQETVADILSRTLLFKAWTSGTSVHQAAWYGFMAEKTLVTTNVTVRSTPTRGTFFLGIGSLSGGGTSTSFRQTMASAPAVYGDLYILNK